MDGTGKSVKKAGIKDQTVSRILLYNQQWRPWPKTIYFFAVQNSEFWNFVTSRLMWLKFVVKNK